MVNQTSRMNAGFTSADRLGPIQGVTHGASSVLNDAMDLAELQVKLLKTDASNCLQTAKVALLGALVAACLMLASLPVLALGLSSLLQWGLNWPLWVCQLVVGGCFSLAGVALGAWCVRHLRMSLRAFSTSQREGAENLRWLRQALSQSLPV